MDEPDLKPTASMMSSGGSHEQRTVASAFNRRVVHEVNMFYIAIRLYKDCVTIKINLNYVFYLRVFILSFELKCIFCM